MSVRRIPLAAAGLVVAAAVLVGTAAASGSPGTPTNLRITAGTDTTVSLAWNASRAGGSNWWYCVQRDFQGCIRVNPPQTTLTRTRLMPGQTFNYSVYAIDSR